MTIDEAIKHCEEVAMEKCKLSDRYSFEEHKCGEEHRQLAEWLKELKSYKEQQLNEDTLEKIRAEIVQMNEDVSKMLMPFDSLEKVKYITGFIDGLGSTLDIIDKYKAESEDEK